MLLSSPQTFSLCFLSVAAVSKADQTVLSDLLGTAVFQPANHKQIYEAYEAYPGYDFDLTERRLVQYDASAPPVVLTELEKIELKAQGVKFFDITDTEDLGSYAQLRQISPHTFPPAPNATEQVKPVIKTLSKARMKQNLETFTGFRTRYYRSETGRQSQLWLLSRINEITSLFATESLRDRISISEFPHSWHQNSIIVKIAGTSSEGVIIIGAHQDSAHTWPFLPAPGADDDGSGTMTILEAYQVLISAGFAPKRTVEFHFYSAEEGGLLGSQAVARDYESRGVNVLAMSQFDMTAWVKRGTREVVGIITDFTNSALTNFNKALVDEYLVIPYVETKCGYACSDHASWLRAGYPSIFTIESRFEESNPYIHSGNDRIDVSDEFSFDHMLEFSKLAVAFAIELGEWN